VNVSPYERTHWDKGRMAATERLNEARRAVAAANDVREMHPGSPFAARLCQDATQRLHWALAVAEEWERC